MYAVPRGEQREEGVKAAKSEPIVWGILALFKSQSGANLGNARLNACTRAQSPTLRPSKPTTTAGRTFSTDSDTTDMRLGPSLWIIPTVLQLVGPVLGQQQQPSSQSSSSPTRRAFRELNSSALDALTAPDPELEGFMDPRVDGGGLKTILIPRVGAFERAGVEAQLRLLEADLISSSGVCGDLTQLGRTTSMSTVLLVLLIECLLTTHSLPSYSVFVQKYLTDVFRGLEWDVETVRFSLADLAP